MRRTLRSLSLPAVFLVPFVIALTGCKSSVQLQKPEFITEDEARKAWRDADSRKKGKKAAAEPEAKAEESILVTDPGEISKGLLQLNDLTFSEAYDRTLTVVQLSTEPLSDDQLKSVREAIEAETKSLVFRAYVTRSQGGKGDYLPWEKVVDGPTATVTVELPKKRESILTYARATTPVLVKSLEVSGRSLWKSRTEFTDKQVAKPVGKDNVPIASRESMVAYPFKVTINVPQQALIEGIPHTKMNKLFNLLNALKAQINDRIAKESGKPALDQIKLLMAGLDVDFGFAVSGTLGDNATVQEIIWDRILGLMSDAVLDAIVADCPPGDAEFVNQVKDQVNRSVLRSIVSESLRCDPDFYSTQEVEESKKQTLTGCSKMKVKLVHPTRDPGFLFSYIEDKYLGYLISAGRFQDYYLDPGDYKEEIAWLNDKAKRYGLTQTDLSFAVVFSAESKRLPGVEGDLQILHPTWQHEQLALQSVYKSLHNSGCEWEGKDISPPYGLKLDRTLTKKENLELARQIAHAHKIKGGIFARFSFAPDLGTNNDLRFSDFNGGTVELYANKTGTGARWIVCNVRKIEQEPRLQIDLLVAKEKAVEGETIAIPKIVLTAKGKDERGIRKVVDYNVEFECTPRAGDFVGEEGRESAMIVVATAAALRGNLDNVTQSMSKSAPQILSLLQPYAVPDSEETYEREEGYFIRRDAIRLLNVGFMPLWHGKLSRIGSSLEVKINVAGAKDKVVVYAPISKESPWNNAEDIALALNALCGDAENCLVDLLKAEALLREKNGEADFRNSLRAEIVVALPRMLPDSQDPLRIRQELGKRVQARIITNEFRNWGLKSSSVAPKVRSHVGAIFAGQEVVLGSGETEIKRQVKLPAKYQRKFTDYGNFLVKLADLRKCARDALVREAALPMASIVLKRKGKSFEAVGKPNRMYFDPGDEEGIIVGLLKKRGFSEDLPTTFFVNIDDKDFLFFCNHSGIKESDRINTGKSTPTWPKEIYRPGK